MRRIRPARLCRAWLFVEGANETLLANAAASGADVLIHELEDFTPPALRAKARALAPELYPVWREAGVLVAVRVNPQDADFTWLRQRGGNGAERDAMVAAEGDHPFASEQRVAHLSMDIPADLANGAGVMHHPVAGVVVDFLDDGHGDVAAVPHFKTDFAQALLQASIPNGACAHIDAAPFLS